MTQSRVCGRSYPPTSAYLCRPRYRTGDILRRLALVAEVEAEEPQLQESREARPGGHRPDKGREEAT